MLCAQHVELEGEDAVVITHSLNDLCPAVLTSKTGSNRHWNAFALDEGWDLELEGKDDGVAWCYLVEGIALFSYDMLCCGERGERKT